MAKFVHLLHPPNRDGYDLITVPEFAKRVHRDRRTVYAWIRTGKLPKGIVYMVCGHLEIDWKLFTEKHLKSV